MKSWTKEINSSNLLFEIYFYWYIHNAAWWLSGIDSRVSKKFSNIIILNKKLLQYDNNAYSLFIFWFVATTENIISKFATNWYLAYIPNNN